MDFLIVTGMSGAGKSITANALEDIGYYCVDNMLPKMLPAFADICKKGEGKLSKVAIIVDIRVGEEFNDLDEVLTQLKDNDIDYKILFLDVANEVAIRRYKETRRKHPLGAASVAEAVAQERKILRSVYQQADFIIDSTHTSASQLRKNVTDIFLSDSRMCMTIQVMSFGFKYGFASEADLVFDVRCLPNPFYESNLQKLTGLDEEVREYVMKWPQSRGLADKIVDLVNYTIPLYIDEGKSQLVIAVGCTGGKHRSVTFAQLIHKHLQKEGYHCTLTHRDITKI